MRSLLTVVIMPTPFANHPAHPSGDSPQPLPHNGKNPKSSPAPTGRGRKTREPRMRASRLKIRKYRRIWTPERARIIRAMLPGVVQTRPPKIRRRGGPAGSPKGRYPPYLTARGHSRLHGAKRGSAYGLERLDIVRHLATPAHVKTRNGHPPASGLHQDGLHPSFPAVQGIA